MNETYMHRCIELALLGQGNVAPNPMVGAVLVHENKIIGEGCHRLYGEAHAEVNCIGSVKPEHRHLIAQSTLYVSLEPCAHFGKTPPCTDLIMEHRIPKVVVGCRDPFPEVDGKGIKKLRAAGVQVEVDILEQDCRQLNKRFFTFHTRNRPYIILKWAQTLDRKIAALSPSSLEEELSPSGPADRLFISNEYSNRVVHKWRSEEMAILVGTNTALVDDPGLNTRLWPGNDPIRLVVDMQLRLPEFLKIFSGDIPTLVFNTYRHRMPYGKMAPSDLKDMGVVYYQVTQDVSLVHQMLNALYQLNIQSVLVEGGARLLQSFIDEDTWDEARIITNEQLVIGTGLPAPVLKNYQFNGSEQFSSDVLRYFSHV